MNDNLVKTLREKTEEADLDTILKTTLGGYSRQSVREYISMMRRQQYDMQQSFAEETQLSQTERDRLARELAEAKACAAAAEEALENAKPLMEKAAGLEKDMDEAVERIREDEARLEQLRQELEEQKAEVRRVQSERDALHARLEREEEKNKALQQELEKRAGEMAVQESGVTEHAAERPETRGSAGVTDLAERSETMQIQLAMLTRERESAAKRMESVIRQEKSLFRALRECQAELENRRDQNQCMEAENNELSRRLSEQVWQNIALNREIIRMRTTNENLKRRLDAALEQPVKHNTPDGSQDAGDAFLWDLAE